MTGNKEIGEVNIAELIKQGVAKQHPDNSHYQQEIEQAIKYFEENFSTLKDPKNINNISKIYSPIANLASLLVNNKSNGSISWPSSPFFDKVVQGMIGEIEATVDDIREAYFGSHNKFENYVKAIAWFKDNNNTITWLFLQHWLKTISRFDVNKKPKPGTLASVCYKFYQMHKEGMRIIDAPAILPEEISDMLFSIYKFSLKSEFHSKEMLPLIFQDFLNTLVDHRATMGSPMLFEGMAKLSLKRFTKRPVNTKETKYKEWLSEISWLKDFIDDAQVLTTLTGWNKGQVLQYIMFDDIPRVSPIEHSLHSGLNIDWVTITIRDKTSLTKERFINLYDQICKDMNLGRHKPLNERTLELINFVEERKDLFNKTGKIDVWKELTKEWNQLHKHNKKWQFNTPDGHSGLRIAYSRASKRLKAIVKGGDN